MSKCRFCNDTGFVDSGNMSLVLCHMCDQTQAKTTAATLTALKLAQKPLSKDDLQRYLTDAVQMIDIAEALAELCATGQGVVCINVNSRPYYALEWGVE